MSDLPGVFRGPALLFFAAAGLVLTPFAVAASNQSRAKEVQEIPLPDLTNAEPQVRDRILEVREEVVAQLENAEAWGRYAIVLDVHRCVPSAERAYARAHLLAPDDFRWAYFHGVMICSTDPERSLPLFDKAMELDPSYVPALVRVGIVYETLGRLDDAWRVFSLAARRDSRMGPPACTVDRWRFSVVRTRWRRLSWRRRHG